MNIGHLSTFIKKLSCIIFVVFLIPIISQSKEKIKEGRISFNLPNENWKLVDKQNQNGLIIYFYKRTPVVDSNNVTLIPNISFLIDEVDEEELDVVTYSILKRGDVSYDIDRVITYHEDKLGIKNAIAHKGRYTDEYGEHTIYFVYIIHKSKGIRVIMDILSTAFRDYENEFIDAMKSLKIY